MSHPYLDTLERYFRAIESGNNDDAIALFAPDALYVRPITSSGVEAIAGRDAILEFLLNRRSKVPAHHMFRHTLISEPDCSVIGVAEVTGQPTLLFFSTATFDDNGLIARYVSAANPISAESRAALEW